MICPWGMNYTIVKVGEEGLGGIMAIPPQAEGTAQNWGGMLPSMMLMRQLARLKNWEAKSLFR
jgi:hypothetical protein